METQAEATTTAMQTHSRTKSVIRSHWWLIALLTLMSASAALLLVATSSATYSSTSRVVVRPEQTSGTPLAPDMGTERAIALSGAVAGPAAELLGIPVAEAVRGLSVTVPVDTTVLQIGYTASTPGEAVTRARGFTQAYVEYRNGSGAGEVASVITPADLPTEPDTRQYPVALSISLVLGLGLGVAAAVIWDRVSGRLRDAQDAETRLDVPVLVSIPHLHVDSVAHQSAWDSAAGSQVFGYLTAKLSYLAPARTRTSLLVTSPAAAAGTTFVAVNLAVALTRIGRDVILVSGDVESAAFPAALDLTPPRRTSSVKGSAAVARSLRSTGIRGLRVLGMGGGADVHGTTLEDLEITLAALRSRADVVVLDAPPLLGGAESVLLAGKVTAVLLVADLDHGRRVDADAAVHALGNVGGTIAGSVVNRPVGLRWRRLLDRLPGVGKLWYAHRLRVRQGVADDEPGDLSSSDDDAATRERHDEGAAPVDSSLQDTNSDGSRPAGQAAVVNGTPGRSEQLPEEAEHVGR